jgi:hypothetical protein
MRHPMRADPNDATAAFTEYAADEQWAASHLTQLAGLVIIGAALILFARMFADRRRILAVLGAAGTIASVSLAGGPAGGRRCRLETDGRRVGFRG